MANRNQIFLKKYNELDVLCREKFNMFTNAQGKREGKSAVREYAYSLPHMYKDKLLNIAKLRNIIAHTGAAEATEQSIRDLDSFIVMIKKNSKPSNPESFEVASYISHNEKKLAFAIKDLEIDEEDIPYASKSKIKAELHGFIDRLKKAKTLSTAKRIVSDFYSYIDSIDEHPLILAQGLNDAKNDAIEQLNEAYNEVMDERKNPFVRAKATNTYKRYKSLILKARSEDEVESLVEMACDALGELA